MPIIGGARVTGRLGGQTLGFLNVVTGRAHGLPGENFSVARVKRDVGEANYIGAMVADRRGGERWNTAAGVDGQFTFSDAWRLDTYVAQTVTEGPGGEGYSYKATVDYSGDTWGLYFDHLTVSPNAAAEAGFIVRDDVRRTDLFGRRRWRPDALGLRRIDLWSGANRVTTVAWRGQDWLAGFLLSPEWESGESVRIFLNRAETVIDEEFELSDEVDIPVGTYRADNVGWFFGTSPSRMARAEANGTVSAFYGGTLVSLGGRITVNPSPKVSVAVGYARNNVDVPGGAFTADISSLRASYSFSTRLSTNLLIQYNSLDDEVSANLRLNLIHRPGSDLFIVFTEQRGVDHRLWDVSDRGLVMKLTYLARL